MKDSDQHHVLEGVKILLVVSDSELLMVLDRCLRMRKATVETATCVIDAIAILEDFQPNILISSLQLPDQSGQALLNFVRTLETERAVPNCAAMALAQPTEQLHDKHLAVGFQTVLGAPFSLSTFVDLVIFLSSYRP